MTKSAPQELEIEETHVKMLKTRDHRTSQNFHQKK